MGKLKKTTLRLKKKPGNKKIERQPRLLKQQRNNLENQEIVWHLKKHNQKYFEGVNKPRKLLATQLKKRKERSWISNIMVEGKEINTKKEIKKEFKKFFAKLYQGRTVNEDEIRTYLAQSELQIITEYQRRILNDQITTEEIEKAIRKIKNGKAPGPDGYTAKFYKIFKEEIITHLKTLYNGIMQGSKVSNSWQQAIVTLIPKDDRKCPNVKKFRPISLLNQDYKIFATILADRLKKVLTDKISKDQTGFLLQRYLKGNVREVINVIEYGDKNPGLKIGLFFVDIEKTFENVNWNFLNITLEEMKLGNNFLRAIKNIYSEQEAQIKINDKITEEFEVQKGTRQGCPLSPLIFIILEVLLGKIQKNQEFKGIKIKSYNLKYKTFTDNIFFSGRRKNIFE